MGVLSMFFAAKDIVIESNGYIVRWNSLDLLSGALMPEPEKATWPTGKGTSITLFNVKEPLAKIEAWVGKASQAFSVPVDFNGEDVLRPLALENMREKGDVFDTELGTLVVTGFSPYLCVILQDSKIYSKRQHSTYGCSAYFYSDNQVMARMPDRDKLIDELDTVKKYEAVLARIQKERLAAIRKDMDNDTAFLDTYFEAVVRWDNGILTDIPYLPTKAFAAASYPSSNSDVSFEYCEPLKSGICKGDSVMVVRDYFEFNAAGNLSAMFAYEANVLCVHNNIPDEHWIFEHAISLSNDTLRIDGEVTKTFIASAPYNYEVDKMIANIGEFYITHTSTGKRVRITSCLVNTENDSYDYGAVNTDLEGSIFIDSQAAHSKSLCFQQLLLQGFSYADEYDNFSDSELNIDEMRLRNLVNALLADTPESFLSELLNDVPVEIINALKGSQLSLSVNDLNKLSVTKAESQ